MIAYTIHNIHKIDSMAAMTMITAKGKANILDWSSHKINIPVISSLEDEAHAAVNAYKKLKLFKANVDAIFNTDNPILIRTDNISFTNVSTTTNSVKDKRRRGLQARPTR